MVLVFVSQLLFLAIGFAALRPANAPTGRLDLFRAMGLPSSEPGLPDAPLLQLSEMETMVWASLSWAAPLTLLSLRTEGPFWTSRAGLHLGSALLFSMSATAVIGATLDVPAVNFSACPLPYLGVALAYNLVVLLVLDFAKVVTHRVLAWCLPASCLWVDTKRGRRKP